LKVRLAEQQYSVPTAQMATAIMRHGCICWRDSVQPFSNGIVGNKNWEKSLKLFSGMYAADVSRVYT
jgi:hypothetical protein